MNYIIERRIGEYVAPSGSASSYTNRLQHARVFTTRESAEREKCGDEHVITVDSVFKVQA